MKNINSFVSTLKSKKNIIIGILVVGMILILIFLSNPSNKGNLPGITTQPSVTPEITTTQTPTPSTILQPNQKLILSSKLVDVAEKKDRLAEYSNVTPLTSTQNLLATNLGFSSSDQKKTYDKKTFVWTNTDKSLVVNNNDNSILYSSNATPTTSGQIPTIDESYLIGRQIIGKLFGTSISSSLINQSSVYYRSIGIYSEPSGVDVANLVRISFYQSIDNYPVVSLSETGAVFTLYLDLNHELYSMSAIGGYTTISQANVLNIIPFSEASKQIDTAIRINTSPTQAASVKTATSKTLNYVNTNTQFAYMLINNNYVPVYLMAGILSGTTAPKQDGLYVIPAATVN